MAAALCSLLVSLAAKGALLLGLALVAALASKRAALRHQILGLAMVGLLALPLGALLLPGLELSLLPAGTPEHEPVTAAAVSQDHAVATSAPASARPAASPVSAGRAGQGTGLPWASLLVGSYLVGAGLSLLRLLLGWRHGHRLAAAAPRLDDPRLVAALRSAQDELGITRPVELGRSASAEIPLTVGILRPRVLVPATATAWPVGRLRLVLLHELAHVRRGDCGWQLVAAIARSLHFFNPLAHLAEHLMRRDRELAADDLVLLAGARPSAYAGELLDVARGLPLQPLAGVAMAGCSRLEGRLRRILDPATDHRPPGRPARLVAIVALLAILAPLSALRALAGARALPASVPPLAADSPKLQALRQQVAGELGRTLGTRPARVELTIDPTAQAVIDAELDAIESRFHPAGATIIALAPESGELLGLGSRGGRNLALEGSYQPASTFKVFTVAAALDAGVLRPDQRIFCENGRMQGAQPGQTITDVQPAGELSVADIMALSSNVGAVKIYRLLGKERLFAELARLHFGERPPVELPAAAGAPLRGVSDVTAEATSFGHGLTVTPLQLAAAFAAVAAGGIYHPPTLVRQAVAADGRVLVGSERGARAERVLRRESAQEVLKMLEGVVHRDDGTGTNARVAGYRVAGKTGSSDRTGLFVGAAPAGDPRLVILVIVDGPQGMPAAYGNAVAAPSFRRVAEALLPRLANTDPGR